MAVPSAYSVKLCVYDVSKGLARNLSQTLLGKQLDGIWHTGVLVYGKEYFFGGGGGITYCFPGELILGDPDQLLDMGNTEIPPELFDDYLRELGKSRFKGSDYHLLDHNCNTFSAEAVTFLTGSTIPDYITGLPAEVMSTSLGQMFKPMIDQLMVQVANVSHSIDEDSTTTGSSGSSNTLTCGDFGSIIVPNQTAGVEETCGRTTPPASSSPSTQSSSSCSNKGSTTPVSNCTAILNGSPESTIKPVTSSVLLAASKSSSPASKDSSGLAISTKVTASKGAATSQSVSSGTSAHNSVSAGNNVSDNSPTVSPKEQSPKDSLSKSKDQDEVSRPSVLKSGLEELDLD